ncbi:uncharacterized protein FIESC28_11105 [Fusarium coffeatum]|uniref:Uncharacterized protein n=1 Tax=Fusarium coffeatum TaxID=231269 RepID=A0A366QN52_9HYPO|nr:uncharacterized protein FIESC28_11105 [Fusarium coffeatum]RBR06303.1 hypothetical protein FIESC28_11105 [Fusarium coffeatum]
MILPINSETAQTIPGVSVPAVSVFNPEPSRYQVFHIQHAPGSHKIFISTSSPRPAGYLYYVTGVSLSGHPQNVLPLMIDTLNSPDQIGNIHESQCVGSIASHDLERVQTVISDHSRLLGQQSFALSPNEPTLCEDWVNVVIAMLLDDDTITRPIVFTNDFTPIIPTSVEADIPWIGVDIGKLRRFLEMAALVGQRALVVHM